MRKLETADFEVTASQRTSESQPLDWWVGKYEFDGDKIVEVSNRASEWQRYRPLVETSNLFFSFARLYESDDFSDGALQWVKQYGFPVEFYYGDDSRGSSLSSILAAQYSVELAVEDEVQLDYGKTESHNTTQWVPANSIYWEKTRENPPSMFIDQLQAKSREAWNTIAHYEALINQEPERVLYLPNGELNPEYQEYMKQPGDRISASLRQRAMTPKDKSWSSREHETLKFIMSRAQTYAETQVTRNINEYCYLKPLGKEIRKELESRWVWSFRNIYGAMYLQMMWLMERGIRVERCKRCLRPFSGEGPKGHKSPDTKVFCGNACRMAYTRAREKAQ